MRIFEHSWWAPSTLSKFWGLLITPDNFWVFLGSPWWVMRTSGRFQIYKFGNHGGFERIGLLVLRVAFSVFSIETMFFSHFWRLGLLVLAFIESYWEVPRTPGRSQKYIFGYNDGFERILVLNSGVAFSISDIETLFFYSTDVSALWFWPSSRVTRKHLFSYIIFTSRKFPAQVTSDIPAVLETSPDILNPGKFWELLKSSHSRYLEVSISAAGN